ncbi:hypothetical protein [Nocardia higoensis]|uniref:hypothetical protein n=1 Tax=Nocardia higoensis TaxID=228599 RepID=UPI0002DC8D75|nr:hypothetical protein [Nocardia higoensis]
MLYDKGALQTLSIELDDHRKDLVTQSGNLQAAAAKLASAWQDNESLVAFNQAKRKWDAEFGDEAGSDPESTIGMMDALSKAVDQALRNAINADSKVAQGFGG